MPKTAAFVAHKNTSSESAQDGDDRKLVEQEDFNPGGKFRDRPLIFTPMSNLCVFETNADS